MEGGRKKRIQQVGKSRKATLGHGTRMSKGTEAGKHRTQMEKSESGGSTRQGRTLQRTVERGSGGSDPGLESTLVWGCWTSEPHFSHV